MGPCPSDEDLAQFLSGEPTPEIGLHLRDCDRCRSAVDRISDEDTLRDWAASLAAAPPSCAEDAEVLHLVEALCGGRSPDRRPGRDRPDGPSAAAPSFDPPEAFGDLGALGPFAVEAEVGRGGMGVVYRARDGRTGRVVALKVLHPELADERARRRFVQEVRAAARVEHDHVVRLYATSDPSDRVPYFVMEYIAGPTLAQEVRSRQRLAPREAAEIVLQAASGLAAAHAAGLVHRDVKPGNILLDPATGRAKIGDFGLARLTAEAPDLSRDGVVAGTPAYLSPEQARGEPDAGPLADVYALGITLYECLTGEPPFRGTSHRVVHQILHDEPRPPRDLNDAVARDLQTICLKAMAKEPARRYAGAAELAADLRRWLAGEPIRARAVGPAGRLWRLARRRPLTAALTIALFVVLSTGTVAVVALWRRAEASAARARAYLVDADRNYRQARDAVDRFYTKVVVEGTLDKPGLEPVRAEVVRGVLEYYRGFLLRRGDDPSLRADAAEASFRVGLLSHDQGDKRDAVAALQHARGLLEALARDRPRDVEVRVKLAKCLDVMGRLLMELGRVDESLDAHKAACDVYRQIAAVEPDNLSWRQLLGIGLGNLANTYAFSRRAPEALHTYRLAREQQETLVRLAPTNVSYRNDLGMTLNNLSMAVDDVEEKLAMFGEALTLRRALVAEEPTSSYLKRNVARTLQNLASVHRRLGHHPEALTLYDEACTALRPIVREFPIRGEYRRELAESLSGRAAMLLELDRPTDALVAVNEALDLFSALTRVDPENAATLSQLVDLQMVAARTHEKLGRLDDALRVRRARLALLERLVRDLPDHADYRKDLADESKAIDDLHARLGQAAEVP